MIYTETALRSAISFYVDMINEEAAKNKDNPMGRIDLDEYLLKTLGRIMASVLFGVRLNTDYPDMMGYDGYLPSNDNKVIIGVAKIEDGGMYFNPTESLKKIVEKNGLKFIAFIVRGDGTFENPMCCSLTAESALYTIIKDDITLWERFPFADFKLGFENLPFNWQLFQEINDIIRSKTSPTTITQNPKGTGLLRNKTHTKKK